ncbi:DUF4369 domain-containing protein [Pedobacter sp.]|uniref:DUF4369 domain-containing protein n=1 Tax=Pedobacter sp. TaxID=1411316 RepID=UPI002CB3AAEF|nr:DUF4369 domain-containing protein [Pedobacter sp.]HWW40178.1 DUF4369 domain-containing protein [Pedobacter sp.]
MVSTTFGQKQFVLKGTLAKEKSGLVRLTYFSMGKTYKDSIRFTGGTFEFKGTIEAPVEASIIINPLYGRIDRDQYYGQDMRDFYLEFGQNQIISDKGLKTAVIKNGAEQAAFEIVQHNEQMIARQLDSLNILAEKYMAANHKAGMDSLRIAAAGIMNKGRRLDSAFIMEHPRSYVALSKLMMAELNGTLEYRNLNVAFDAFSKSMRDSYKGRFIEQRLKTRGKLLVGKPAPEISLPGPDEKLFLLSELKGKNVLVCFLQSPTNRILVNAYPELSASNIQVYAITFSDDRLSWKSLVASEASEWINVRDDNEGQSTAKGMLSKVGKDYNLTPSSASQCILLDSSGHILSGMMPIDPSLVEKVKKLIPNHL